MSAPATAGGRKWERMGDPRRLIAERFGDREGYLERVRREADNMVIARLLLAEDVAAADARAGLLWDFIRDRRSPGA